MEAGAGLEAQTEAHVFLECFVGFPDPRAYTICRPGSTMAEFAPFAPGRRQGTSAPWPHNHCYGPHGEHRDKQRATR
jgi:hypothetical protein